MDSGTVPQPEIFLAGTSFVATPGSGFRQQFPSWYPFFDTPGSGFKLNLEIFVLWLTLEWIQHPLRLPCVAEDLGVDPRPVPRPEIWIPVQLLCQR